MTTTSTPRFKIRVIDGMAVAAVVALCGYYMATRPPRTGDTPTAFVKAVNLDPLHRTAVQADGRLRSFESHAKSFVGLVTGPRLVRDQSYGFTYLDMIFRPDVYWDTPAIFVKNKLVLYQLVDILAEKGALDEEQAEAAKKSRLLARKQFDVPEVKELLARLRKDLIRTAKAVDQIESALFFQKASVLVDRLAVVVPEGAAANTPWASISQLAQSPSGMPQDSAHAGVGAPAPVPGVAGPLQEQINEHWSALRNAWRQEDAATVNTEIEALAAACRATDSSLYPSAQRLAAESWYFRSKSMTWVWLLYLAAVLPLLMSFMYKWDKARVIGMVLFLVAFGFHTAAVGLRWYISDRWPNSNMFEAVTTAAWFGGVGALVIEVLVRKTVFRNLFALGSAVMSMLALMAARFLPVYLDPTIRNKMAALNDIWLYIHTNVIIFSYAVIGLACVPAVLLLRDRWCKAWDEGTVPKARLWISPIAFVAVNVSGWFLLMHLLAPSTDWALGFWPLVATALTFWCSTVVLGLELFAARDRVAHGAKVERAASGGASAIIMGSPGGGSFLKPERPTAGQVLDGVTMVAVEVSFIMLFVGTIMGAIWADHSWGRPWGWDPKEVFALNTFLIFVVLIHVRLKVRDKAFWTAILAIFGFQVMLFNWIVVNFVITGLHSYA